MEQLFLIAHVLIAIAIIGLVLIQQGKGADVGAAFGSGASGSLFGSVGATSFLLKLTASLAILFFVTSLSLGYLAGKRSNSEGRESVADKLSRVQIEQKATSEAPAAASPAPNSDIPAITDQPAPASGSASEPAAGASEKHPDVPVTKSATTEK